MRMCFLLSAAAVTLLSSCLVTTSVAVVDSCTYAPREEDTQQAQIYRMGSAYYLKLGVRYVCKEDRVCVAGMMAVPDSEVWLPISYHDEMEPRTLYVLLDDDAVKYFVGVKPPKLAADVPCCIDEKAWDEASASLCRLVHPLPKGRINVYKTRGDGGCCFWKAKDARYHSVNVYLPSIYGWDAVYKFPLATVLAVGVDVPCTLVANIGMLTGAIVAAPLMAPAQQQQQCCEQSSLPEPKE